MATLKKKSGFDLQKFEKMSAPFRIRIDRQDRKSGKSEPIPLPQDVWSKEDAQNIEQIVINDIAGGGAYKAQLTDQGGQSFDWEFFFPPDIFPPKVPPMLAGAMGPPPMTAPPPMPMPSSNGSSWTPGFYGTPYAQPHPPYVPPYQPQQHQQQHTQPQYPYQTQSPYNPYMPSPPWATGWGYDTSSLQSTSRTGKDDAKSDALQREIEQLRAANLTEAHRREREGAESRHRQEMARQDAAFKEEMRAIRELMTANKKPTGDDDPAVQALKAQVEEMRRTNERLQHDREKADAEARHREEMRVMREGTEKQIEALKNLVEKSGEGKINPQMQMLIELQRSQSDSQREQGRAAAENARESSRIAAEQPRVMVEMMERLKAASGSEQLFTHVADAYKGSNEMYKGAMEMMMQMQGSPGWEMAGQALEGAKKTVEQFLSGKRDSEVAKARAEAIKAQSAAYAAQQQQQQVFYGPQGVPTPEQLAAMQAAEQAEADEEEIVRNEDDEDGEEGAPHEAKIFGVVYDKVLELRQAVNENQLNPDQVAEIIVGAVVELDKREIIVPAFTLIVERRFADLIDVLLPRVPSDFAGATTQELERRISALINSDGPPPPSPSDGSIIDIPAPN